MERRIVFRLEPNLSDSDKRTWVIPHNRLPESARESTLLWEGQPLGMLSQNKQINLQQTEFVLLWNDRKEERHEFTFMEFELYQDIGTCWKQDYRLDRVLESMCRQMNLPSSRLELSNFLFDWFFYPKTQAQVLSKFEPGGERL